MNKKSVIFTLDAIMAVLIAGIMITSAYFFISQTDAASFNRQNLNKISLDVLAVLEKDNTLKGSVESGSASELDTFLAFLPSPLCGKVTVFDSNFTSVLTAQKSGCDFDQPAVSRRIFVTDNFDVYYAEASLAFS